MSMISAKDRALQHLAGDIDLTPDQRSQLEASRTFKHRVAAVEFNDALDNLKSAIATTAPYKAVEAAIGWLAAGLDRFNKDKT
jgi:hypothetical protein